MSIYPGEYRAHGMTQAIVTCEGPNDAGSSPRTAFGQRFGVQWYHELFSTTWWLLTL
jgi:hypothetical protein